MRREALVDTCTALCNTANKPKLAKLISYLPFLPIDIRKSILDLCRIQYDPRNNVDLYTRFFKSFQWNTRAIDNNYLSFSDLVDMIFNEEQDVVTFSLLSMAVRSFYTIHKDEMQEILDESFKKEFGAARSNPMSPVVNWELIFAPSSPSVTEAASTIIGRISPPSGLYTIREKLSTWRSQMEGNTLFPKLSSKHLPPSAYQEIMKDDDISPYGVRISTVEREQIRFFSEKEATSQGCAVKHAWKFNDLKPRVYYQAGLESNSYSSHIRSISNGLKQKFETCSTRTAQNFERLFQRWDYQFHKPDVIIYDFTSFTSGLAELPRFLEGLASYCHGVEVSLVHPCKGIIVEDLGDIIASYNHRCGVYGNFDIRHFVPEDERDHYQHTVAGMLGVHGNIVFSTVVHAMFAILLTGSDLCSSVVGDDGLIIIPFDMDIDEIEKQLGRIGVLEPGKSAKVIMSDAGNCEFRYKYLKRPIHISSASGVHVSPLLDFPILPEIFGVEDEMHTVPERGYHERAKLGVTQISRFLDKLESRMSSVTPETWTLLEGLFRWIYREFHLPVNGGLPPYVKYGNNQKFHLAVPNIQELNSGNWLELLLEGCQCEFLEMPRVTGNSNTAPYKEHISSNKTGFLSSPWHGMWSKLGFLQMAPIVQLFVRDERIDQLFKDFIRGDVQPLYEAVEVFDLPSWYKDAVIRGVAPEIP